MESATSVGYVLFSAQSSDFCAEDASVHTVHSAYIGVYVARWWILEFWRRSSRVAVWHSSDLDSAPQNLLETAKKLLDIKNEVQIQKNRFISQTIVTFSGSQLAAVTAKFYHAPPPPPKISVNEPIVQRKKLASGPIVRHNQNNWENFNERLKADHAVAKNRKRSYDMSTICGSVILTFNGQSNFTTSFAVKTDKTLRLLRLFNNYVQKRRDKSNLKLFQPQNFEHFWQCWENLKSAPKSRRGTAFGVHLETLSFPRGATAFH